MKTTGMLQPTHLLATLLTVLLLSSPATAATFFESEPNNTPINSNRVQGAATLTGSLPGPDQDGYRWTVTDNDAVKSWTLTLHGVPGRLTIVDIIRVEYTDDGTAVARQEKLLTIGSRDGAKPVSVEELVFEPGEYLLGVAHGGANASAAGGGFRPPIEQASFGASTSQEQPPTGDDGYRLGITEAGSLHIRNPSSEPDTRETAIVLRPNRISANFLNGESSWYRIDINEKASEQRWHLRGQLAVGRSSSVSLYDHAGERLAKRSIDRLGKFSLPDLGLEAGSYYVELQGSAPGNVRIVSLDSSGTRIDGAEFEPNDKFAQANRFDFSGPVTGRAGDKRDEDHYVFQSDDAVSDRINRLVLSSASAHPLELCLRDARGKPVQCKRGSGKVALTGLLLTHGVWSVSVGRMEAMQEYTLVLEDGGAILPGFEGEPNDRLEHATAIPGKLRVKGHTDGNEDDFFKLIVTEKAQLWRFQVMGEGIHEIAYLDSAGKQGQVIRAQKDQRRVRLENVYLLPGTHYLRITGRSAGDYTLLARPLGPPNPNAEREPNDDATRTLPLTFGLPRTGLLSDKADTDNYRFSLRNYDHVKLKVQPPVDGSVGALLYWDGRKMKEALVKSPGQALELSGVFPPGNYRLQLSTDEPSEAEYQVELTRLPRFSCSGDCEPNDSIAFANSVPADGIIEGLVNTWRDPDWFKLPVFEVDTDITATMTPKRKYKVITFAEGKSLSHPIQLVGKEDETGARRGVIPAGEQAYIQVVAWGDPKYKLSVEFPGQSKNKPIEPVSLSLRLDSDTVSAYREPGQTLRGELVLDHPGGLPAQLTLQATSSDYRWRVKLGGYDTEHQGQTQATIPVTIEVPPDAWADREVRISAGVYKESLLVAEAFADVKVDSEATVVNPAPSWPIPQTLLGGFNVAASALGGRWMGGLDTAVGKGFEKTIDGLAVRGEGLSLRGSQVLNPATELDIALAGTDGLEIAGVTINLLSGDSIHAGLREVELFLSMDGETYSPALVSPLLPVKSEQVFVLETPTRAKFARLRLEKSFYRSLNGGGGNLGEFKVIATPGQDISGGQGFNLASPELGGHVVWSQPTLEVKGWDQSLLTSNRQIGGRRLKPGETLRWVIGFHHDRAALLDRLEWHPNTTPRHSEIEAVEVSVSTDSPIGPWRPVGAWQVGGEAGATTFRLPEDTWARFIRFSVAPPSEQTTYELPDVIEAWEKPVSDNYHSILSEWGFANQAAIYEYQWGFAPYAPAPVRDNTSKNLAASLQPGKAASGQVQLGGAEHWYRYDLPSQDNSLVVSLDGNPTVRTRLEFFNNEGEILPAVVRGDLETQNRKFQEVYAAPGSSVYLRVHEPPRNVAFLWDTSASVGAYLPVIYSALTSYAQDLSPGRDAANLLPFGEKFLLSDWYGDPYVMQTVLTDYPRKESSSAAERSIADAARALELRDGTKAIVLITDAATGHYPPMWPTVARTRPRIFALGMSSHGAFGRNPAREQDLQQDWSRINEGRYDPVLNEADMEIAFDRASTMLRRPAPYRLVASSSFKEAPGPGLLQVNSGSKTQQLRGAVALILDASGSMLKRMQGTRRIQIAREVLIEAVSKHLPPGTPVSLRVFGHREPNACRTDLVAPLGPLDPTGMARILQGIDAMNLAKTPIAKSLQLAAADLKQAEGRKSILLVTDGEETCDGNPQAVIRQLADQGFDMSLNIVGFAINDPALENQFGEWASEGNGAYYTADDRSGLQDAILQALQVYYEVYDQTGEQVATGALDGEALELPQGDYRIVVKTSPAVTLEKVSIQGEKTTSINLDQVTGQIE